MRITKQKELYANLLFLVNMGDNVASPISTGGAGTAYEQYVGAMFLAHLLTCNPPPVFCDCPVTRVSFQTGHSGWRTDDLLIVCSTDKGEKRKMVVQIKRTFVVGKNPNCTKTFQGFWEDFNAKNRFDPDKDIILLATLRSTANLASLDKLHNCAQDSRSVDEFKNRLESSGFIDKAASRHYETIRSVVKENDAASGVDDESLWRFLKTIHVLFLDLTTKTAQMNAPIIQMLAQSANGTDVWGIARATWHELVMIATEAAAGAQTLDHCDLPEAMREKHRAIPGPVQLLADHSKTTLDDIRTTIAGKVTLPRTNILTKTTAAIKKSRVVALTGPAGSGKSVLAKRAVEQKSRSQLCLSFRAEEFADTHIDRVLPGPISGRTLESIIRSQERTLIHVESLERILDSTVRDAFVDLIGMVERCPNVSLLLTCRDSDMATAAAFFDGVRRGCHMIKVPPLSKEETRQVGEKVPILKTLLSRPELEQILCTPYVLDMATNMRWPDHQDGPSNMKAFREKWWKDVVRNDRKSTKILAGLRERALVDLSVSRARQLRPSVMTDGINHEALYALHSDGLIIMEDTNLAAPAHDIIEDWAIMRCIESLATKHELQARPMVEDLGASPAIRRGFRKWLKEQLDTDAENAKEFVLVAHNNTTLPGHFRDDVLISVLLSGAVRYFVSQHKDSMLADDARLLVKMMQLTQVACTKVPSMSDGQPRRESVVLEPEGEAWPVLLEVIDGNLKSLLPRHYKQILEMLKYWSRGTQSQAVPEGAIWAISVAYSLLHILRADSDDVRRILQIIASVPRAHSSRFLNLVKRASSKSECRDIMLGKFRDILMGRLGFPACRDFPEEMAGFIRSLCIPEEHDLDRVWSSFNNLRLEFKFGLCPYAISNFLHFSAFRGPFWALLMLHPDIGIRLILDLANYAGDWYGTNGTDKVSRIVVPVPGHVGVIQWADDRLWQAYRGASEAPHVIMCALMALEEWLLKMCDQRYIVGPLLLRILRESRNVMTTGVVSSVCSAHPDLCGAVPLALLKSKDCISLDQSRLKKEGDTPLVKYAAPSIEDRYYDDERRKSNALPHRRRDLKALALKLQINMPYPNDDYAGIGKSVVASDAEKTDAGGNRIGTGTKKDPQTDTFILLHGWGTRLWKRESDDGNPQLWRRALALAKESTRQRTPFDPEQSTEDGAPIVAAVCVRDHWERMSGDDRRWCASMLVNEICIDCNSTRYAVCYLHGHAGASQMAARTLPKILAHDPDNREILGAVGLAITHAASDVSSDAARGVARYLGPNHLHLMLRCMGAVAMLSNLVADDRDEWSRTQWKSIPDGPGDAPNPRKLVRQAFVAGRVDTEKELKNLDLTSWYGRNAAGLIMPMLGSAPDLPLTKGLIAKILQAVMGTKTREHGVLHISPDLEFENDIMGSLADIVLAMPQKIPTFCQPLLDAVDGHPYKTAHFIETLVMRKSLAVHAFWDVWQAFADRITKSAGSSRMFSDDPGVAELVRMMLFNMHWSEDSRGWEHLVDHGERVDEFVRRLPPAPHVLASFAFYLYKMGEDSLPDALTIVADHLQSKSHAELPIDKNTVAHMSNVGGKI